MAHIQIYISGLNGVQDTSKVNINGYARMTGQSDQDAPAYWNVDVNSNATSASIIADIKAAAIAAAEVMEFTIGALDKKTLYGGPSDLAL